MNARSHYERWAVTGGCVTATALDDDWQVGIEFGTPSGIQAVRYMTCGQARDLASALLAAADHYEDVRKTVPVRDMQAVGVPNEP